MTSPSQNAAQPTEASAQIALLRATLEASADGVVVTDANGIIKFHNQSFVGMWRLESRHVEGRQHRDILKRASEQISDPDAFLRRIDQIYSTNEPQTLDILELQDGRIYECYSKAQQIDGQEVTRVWTFRDVTERVQVSRINARLVQDAQRTQQTLVQLNDELEQRVAERTAALRKSELQFQQLVSGITDYAIYMIDRTGHIVSWNAGAERIKGYRADEIIGKHFSSFYTEEDRAADMPAYALETAERQGKYEAEAWRVRKDGTRFWANVLIDPIRGPDGQIIGFAKITRDMTERRAMQEQLNQSQKMEAIGQLTGGVAHDFNNLLTVVLGNLETIQRHSPESDERTKRAIDQAMRGAQRAATLTQQLLAFARRQPLDPKPTDVNRLIRGLSELIRRTLSENIQIETHLAADLWRVEADPHQLENALLNLAVNARDAMPKGGTLIVETQNATIDRGSLPFADFEPGDYVAISVIDTGTGMSAEVMAHAFDPFFTTKPIGQGTGLGLSQVFGFVRQSGGHIKLYSEVDQGTTVKIYLPRLARESDKSEPEAPLVVPGARDHETILVVEDDEDVRSYSAGSLRDLGFTVLEANDGPSALRMLEVHPEIQLLFTDVGLPGINGRQLVDAARGIRPDLHVLFTSGYARSAIVHQGRLDAGVQLLTKPFTRAQLAMRVREALDSQTSELQSTQTILVVEDEALVRMYLSDLLEQLGFSVVETGTVRDALGAMERNPLLAAAFIDVGLPDGNGLELAAQIRERYPHVKVVVASGYAQRTANKLEGDPNVCYLKKPFDGASTENALKAIGIATRGLGR
ncbi:MAG TPA: PAS domain S-box protein [Steroidobacteraceae bacterium]|nr:PAS domain S-box protein [Steroidobacteraceae bacterium]